MSDKCTALFVCAVSQELEWLRQILDYAYRGEVTGFKKIPRVGRHFVEGPGFVAIQGGIGKTLAAATCEYAIGRWDPVRVVDFGMAGALTGSVTGDGGAAEEVKVGDVLLPTSIIELDFGGSVGPDFFCSTRVSSGVTHSFTLTSLRTVRFLRGKLASQERNILSGSDRVLLRETTSAIAVCWEAAGTARIAGLHQRDFESIRIISDTAESPPVPNLKLDKILKENLASYCKQLVSEPTQLVL